MNEPLNFTGHSLMIFSASENSLSSIDTLTYTQALPTHVYTSTYIPPGISVLGDYLGQPCVMMVRAIRCQGRAAPLRPALGRGHLCGVTECIVWV